MLASAETPVDAVESAMVAFADDNALARRAREELPVVTLAYDQLVRRHYQRVRLLARLMAPAADSDAIAQDVMMRVYRGLPRFRGEASFSTWLHRIIQNVARTHQMRELREAEKRTRAAADWEESGADESASEHDPFGVLVGQLSAEERTLIAFRFLEDLELHEIAEVMGVTLSAAKMRYYRALAKLKDKLCGD